MSDRHGEKHNNLRFRDPVLALEARLQLIPGISPWPKEVLGEGAALTLHSAVAFLVHKSGKYHCGAVSCLLEAK